MPSTEHLETAVKFIKESEAYLANGKFKEATAACEKALSLRSDLPEAYQTLGKIKQAQGFIQEAKDCYEKALALNPNLPEIYANLGMLFTQEQNWGNAIAAYEKAIALAPNFVAAYRNLGRVLAQVGNQQASAKCWYQALTLDPHWATADEHLTLGNTLIEQNQIEEAKVCYQRAIQLNPHLETAYHNLGEILTSQKQWEEAIASYRKAIDLNPEFYAAHHSLGKALTGKGDIDEAIVYFKRSVEIKPDYVRAWHNLGNALVQKDDLDAAILSYQKTLELSPTAHWTHHSLGDTFAKQQRWEDAVACYQKAIELQPNVAWFYYTMGIALTHQKSWDAAASAYVKAMQLQINIPGLYNRLGYVLRKRAESGLEEAIAAYCQAVQIDPQTGKTYHQLLKVETETVDFYLQIARECANRNQFEGAVIFYQISLQIEPNLLEVLVELEKTTIYKEEMDRQIAIYRRGIELNSKSPQNYTDLGNLLPQLGELQEAIACHQKASQLRGWPECAEKNYHFTNDWFTHNLPIWKRYLQQFAGIPGFNAVEIGSFQGMSACWLLDYILTDATAKITCIDLYFQDQFDGNIVKTGAAEKVVKLQGLSQDLLVTLPSEVYDLAYIDGCHKASSALQDTILCWRLVKVGGWIIFDDYEFTFPDHPEQNTKIGIETFLSLFSNQIELIHKGYQLIVKKIAPGQPTEEKALLAQGYQQLGEAVAELGYLEEAIAHHQKALEIEPNMAVFHHKLGKVLQQKGELEAAIAAYQRSIELAPQFSWAYHFLGETFQSLGEYHQAAIVYHKATELNPEFCWSYNSLGDVFMKLEQWEEAASAYRKCIELNPEFCWTYNQLGEALIQLEQWEEAATAYRRSIALNPDFSWSYYSLGEILEKQEKWVAVVVAYQRAFELKPDDEWLCQKLGKALQKVELWDTAIDLYQQWLDRNPNVAWCYEGIGLCFLGKQQWENAISYFTQALQIQPDLLDAYHRIGDALEKLGNLSESDYIDCQFQMLPLKVLKQYCNFTEDLAIETQSHPEIQCIPIHPVTQRTLPTSPSINDTGVFLQRTFDMGPGFVAILPNGRAWADGITSVAIDAENRLVNDLSTGCGEIVITSNRLPPAESIDGTVAFLSVRWGGGSYFHWMLDIIARFDLLQRSGIDINSIDKFVVNSCEYSYQQETLETLGIPPEKIIESRPYYHVKAKQLIVPSIPARKFSAITRWGCEFLKKAFLNPNRSQTLNYPKFLYISRKQANYRRILNEEEVLTFLEKFGFECAALETLSIAEQADCLAAAEIIVAPHGAGLTNLIFCNPGTKVIEIFPPTYIPDCYWQLSNVCDLEHYHLIGEILEDDTTSNHPVHKNIRVDLDSLEQLMNIAGAIHE